MFYYDGFDEFTFFRFYSDGRVIRYGRYTKHDRMFHSYVWFTLEEEQAHMFRGIYQLDKGNGFRIVIKGEYGTMIYQGTIRDENTIDLSYGCPITNFGKSASFSRFSFKPHKVQIELSEIYTN